jgi:Family of unknown function (DUF6165)
MAALLVPVSPGELLDKITILRIKAARISDAAKLANVRRELEVLERTWHDSPLAGGGPAKDVCKEVAALEAVNARLWDIEDDIRNKERARAFDARFIELARAVYIENDERARLKRQINDKLGSAIVEEKSYRKY